MTNNEIEKYKEEVDIILKELKPEKDEFPANYLKKLGQGIKKLQDLSDRTGARKYIGMELNDIDSITEKSGKVIFEQWGFDRVKMKLDSYKPICKEISDNINFKLQTEMMFNACISAKRSCRWAAIAAIAACIGTIITWWPSISKVLGRYF